MKKAPFSLASFFRKSAENTEAKAAAVVESAVIGAMELDEMGHAKQVEQNVRKYISNLILIALL